jgi:hypothetical protein
MGARPPPHALATRRSKGARPLPRHDPWEEWGEIEPSQAQAHRTDKNKHAAQTQEQSPRVDQKPSLCFVVGLVAVARGVASPRASARDEVAVIFGSQADEGASSVFGMVAAGANRPLDWL